MGADQVAEMLHFLGAFVGLEYPPTPFLRAVTENPKQHTELARTALRRFLELDAGRRARSCSCSTICSGPTTRRSRSSSELSTGLARLAGRDAHRGAARDARAHREGWGEGAVDHTRIDLRNLEPDDRRADVPKSARALREIPEDTAQDAVEMTGGNPAFLEQLVRLFLDNGTIDTSRRRCGSSIPTRRPRPSCRSRSRRRSRRASPRSRPTSATCSRRRRCSATCSGCRR